MTRLSASLVVVGLLSMSLVTASPEFDQEEQNRNASCDNGCFFSSFPGGSCTNDAACMCTQQIYREKYFCCMAEKCAASVLPASIQRQTSECEARNMPFTFDAEAVCGIKLTTSTASAAPTSTIASSSTGPSADSSTGIQTSSGGSTPTPTDNSAPVQRVLLNDVAILVAVSGMLFW